MVPAKSSLVSDASNFSSKTDVSNFSAPRQVNVANCSACTSTRAQLLSAQTVAIFNMAPRKRSQTKRKTGSLKAHDMVDQIQDQHPLRSQASPTARTGRTSKSSKMPCVPTQCSCRASEREIREEIKKILLQLETGSDTGMPSTGNTCPSGFDEDCPCSNARLQKLIKKAIAEIGKTPIDQPLSTEEMPVIPGRCPCVCTASYLKVRGQVVEVIRERATADLNWVFKTGYSSDPGRDSMEREEACSDRGASPSADDYWPYSGKLLETEPAEASRKSTNNPGLALKKSGNSKAVKRTKVLPLTVPSKKQKSPSPTAIPENSATTAIPKRAPSPPIFNTTIPAVSEAATRRSTVTTTNLTSGNSTTTDPMGTWRNSPLGALVLLTCAAFTSVILRYAITSSRRDRDRQVTEASIQPDHVSSAGNQLAITDGREIIPTGTSENLVRESIAAMLDRIYSRIQQGNGQAQGFARFQVRLIDTGAGGRMGRSYTIFRFNEADSSQLARDLEYVPPTELYYGVQADRIQ